jgi:hypothetical protein
MADRTGIFAGDDPFALARNWLAEAEGSEINDPNAMAIASADANGLPNVRMVLLKEITDHGFWFYTNYESAKGRELLASGKAAGVLHWKSLRRQLRFRGPVTQETGRRRMTITRPARSRAALAPGPRASLGRLGRAASLWRRWPRSPRKRDRTLTVRHSGAGFRSSHWKSSSGPMVRFACTTVSSGDAKR